MPAFPIKLILLNTIIKSTLTEKLGFEPFKVEKMVEVTMSFNHLYNIVSTKLSSYLYHE